MRRGLDTNVLVYALDSEAGRKHDIAVKIVEHMLHNPNEYAVSAQVLAEMIYVVKRKRVGEDLATRLTIAVIDRVPLLTYTGTEIIQALQAPRRYF